MGVLNVTPDSFSDGGEFIAPEQALAQARRMIAEGADIIDIGAESTRPYSGAQPVTADDEWRGCEPVLAAVVALGIPVSIDSMKAAVVAWALDQGAAIANDVWGLQRDADMAPWSPRATSPIIVMHNRDSADPAIDIMQDIAAFFERSLDIAAQGRHRPRQDRARSRHRLRQDARAEHDCAGAARRTRVFGLPLLVGASRKRFIATVSPSEPTAAARRLDRRASDRRTARRANHPHP